MKVTVQIRKKRRRPKTEVSHPLAGMTTALAARYEVMTHDISSMLAENEPCMWGRATLVMLVSSTCITVTSMTESVMAHFRADPTGASLTARRRIRAGSSCLHMCTENPGDVKPGPGGAAAGLRRSASARSSSVGTRLARCDDMDVNPTRSSRAAIAGSLREMAGLLALAGESPFRARAYERAATAIEHLDVGSRRARRSGAPHRASRHRPRDRGHDRGAAADGPLQGAGRPARAHAAGRALARPDPRPRARQDQGTSCRARRRDHRRAQEGLRRGARARCQGHRREDGAPPPRADPGPRGTGGRQAPPRPRLALAESFTAHLRAAPGVVRAEIAGALRRRAETVDRLVFVAAARGAGARHRPRAGIAPRRRRLGPGGGKLLRGPRRRRPARAARRRAGSLCRRAARRDGLGRPPARPRARGPRARARARRRRPRLDSRPARASPAAGEEDLYRHLGLPYVPPELREGSGEVEAAEAGRLPDDLVTAGDLRGLVHCHTVYSDGKHTIAEMARAADAMGMRYLTITDHSPTAFYARGLDVDRLRAQWDEIARVQETVSVRLLRGTESDILADGGLDYPDAILEQLDVVIASIHARHRMDADRMTRRLVRAMQHPCFKIWGHALGRLVLSRPPIECRVEEVLDAAAAAPRRDRDQRRSAPPRPRAALDPRGPRARASPSSSRPTRIPSTPSPTSATAWRWRGAGGCGAARCSTRSTPRRSCGRRRAGGSRREPRLPALAGALRGRARAPALRRTRPLRPRPAPARGAGADARRDLLVPERPLLPRQARLRARLRRAAARAARRPRHHDERWAVPRRRAGGPRAPRGASPRPTSAPGEARYEAPLLRDARRLAESLGARPTRWSCSGAWPPASTSIRCSARSARAWRFPRPSSDAAT